MAFLRKISMVKQEFSAIAEIEEELGNLPNAAEGKRGGKEKWGVNARRSLWDMGKIRIPGRIGRKTEESTETSRGERANVHATKKILVIVATSEEDEDGAKVEEAPKVRNVGEGRRGKKECVDFVNPIGNNGPIDHHADVNDVPQESKN